MTTSILERGGEPPFDSAPLAERAERLLEATIAPWRPLALDLSARAGFVERRGPDHRPIAAPSRTLVGQCRHLWAVATLAREGIEDLGASVWDGVGSLRQAFWRAEEGAFRWRVCDEDSGVSEESLLYGAAFGVFALAAAVRASGSDRIGGYLAEAIASLRRHHFDPVHGGFFEVVRPNEGPVLDPAWRSPIGVPPDRKGQNATLHVLEALTEAQLAAPSAEGRALLAEAYDWLARRTWQEPFEGGARIAPVATRAGEPLDGPASYGHDIQAVHLLRSAAAVLGLDPAPVRSKTRLLAEPARRRMAASQGGRAGFTDHGDPDGPRTWWVAAEALLTFGALAAGGEGYDEEFEATFDFIESAFLDPIHGGWHEAVTADGEPIPGDKGGPWKSPYHDLRAALGLRRLLTQNLLP